MDASHSQSPFPFDFEQASAHEKRLILRGQGPLTLEPEATLRWVGEAPPAAEAWLPPVAVMASREALENPAPAHQVLAELRRVAPIGDRRLLVGLQWLCASGVVDVVG